MPHAFSLEDSGQFPLTRDGGFKMITVALEKFEADVIKGLTTKIDENTKQTLDLTKAFERLRGVAIGFGLVLAAPGVIWVCLQIYDRIRR